MYKLIIADDEALMRAGLYYRNDWNSMGFEVVAVLEDGSDVLEFLEEQRADVLLADISMYRVSGLEVAKVIREKYPWMKVVLLSVYQEFEYAREAVRCRVHEYLLKPVDYDKLKLVFENIKLELDALKQEELLMQDIGKLEYAQIVDIAKRVTDAVLGKDNEKWVAYAYLRNIINNTSMENRIIVIRKVISSLLERVHDMAPGIKWDFEDKLHEMDFDGDQDIGDERELISLLCLVNNEILSHALITSKKKSSDTCILKACNWIENHLGEEFTYEDVADFVHLSPRHFIRCFRKAVGETFSDYVLRLRMEAAKRLAEENVMHLEDISLAVGYRDGKYFQQLFKKYVGCSIKEYRNGGNI